MQILVVSISILVTVAMMQAQLEDIFIILMLILGQMLCNFIFILTVILFLLQFLQCHYF